MIELVVVIFGLIIPETFKDKETGEFL